MINQSLAVISGSFITAKPIGIHNGVDYQYTGKVRKIADIQIQQQLAHHAIVLLSPLGLSPSGESYNLLHKDVAVQTAKALHADKLIFLQPLSHDLPRQLTLKDAKKYTFANHLIDYIEAALQAGVTRVHLINALHNGSLLSELYTRDGAGTLISNDHYDAVTSANVEDIAGIIDLIRPLEKKGVLIRRSREQLELEIANFTVIKRDQKVIACAALYPMKSVNSAELACFVVDNHYRGQSKGDLLLNFIENQAKKSALKQLFVLTTQTTDWFRERGFKLAQVNDLPEEKKKLYNYQRNSKILLKTC
jgi:amino-acid N-acetyltransferase